MAAIPWHMGSLHGVEWLLFLALLLGPFIAVGVTVVVVRRRDARETEDENRAGGHPPDRGDV